MTDTANNEKKNRGNTTSRWWKQTHEDATADMQARFEKLAPQPGSRVETPSLIIEHYIGWLKRGTTEELYPASLMLEIHARPGDKPYYSIYAIELINSNVF